MDKALAFCLSDAGRQRVAVCIIGSMSLVLSGLLAARSGGEEEAPAQATAEPKYTVFVFKIVDGKRVKQEDRTFVTKDLRKAQLYYLRAKNATGWTAELFQGERSESPQEPATAPAPEKPQTPDADGPLPMLKIPPVLVMLPATPLDGFPPLNTRLRVTVKKVEEFVVGK